VTAGTLFDRRRTPLTVWFEACWLFASGTDGMSALSLQRALEIGSYPTAWAMLHRLRSVLVRPGRDRLTGTVEVDETYIGGEEPGLRGGRARGKKALVGIAVEVTEPRGFGRCRMQILADASAAMLHPFVTAHVEPGTRVITDGWQGYRGIDNLGYLHEPRSQRAARRVARTSVGCCPACTASPRWPSDGCWAPTRARSTQPTCRATSTSSCSGSTGAAPASEACSSTGFSSWPSRTPRSATATWSPTHSPEASRPSRPHRRAIPQAWTGHGRTDLGERSDLRRSGRLNTPQRPLTSVELDADRPESRASRPPPCLRRSGVVALASAVIVLAYA